MKLLITYLVVLVTLNILVTSLPVPAGTLAVRDDTLVTPGSTVHLPKLPAVADPIPVKPAPKVVTKPKVGPKHEEPFKPIIAGYDKHHPVAPQPSNVPFPAFHQKEEVKAKGGKGKREDIPVWIILEDIRKFDRHNGGPHYEKKKEGPGYYSKKPQGDSVPVPGWHSKTGKRNGDGDNIAETTVHMPKLPPAKPVKLPQSTKPKLSISGIHPRNTISPASDLTKRTELLCFPEDTTIENHASFTSPRISDCLALAALFRANPSRSIVWPHDWRDKSYQHVDPTSMDNAIKDSLHEALKSNTCRLGVRNIQQYGEVNLGNLDAAELIERAVACGSTWNGERVGAEGKMWCQSWRWQWGTYRDPGPRHRRSEVEWAVFHRGGGSEKKATESQGGSHPAVGGKVTGMHTSETLKVDG